MSWTRGIEFYDGGRERAFIASALSIPEERVRRWLGVYRSVGIKVLAMIDPKKTGYSFETKLAFLRAVADYGTTKAEAIGEVRHRPPISFKGWLKVYRENGSDALSRSPGKGRRARAGRPGR